MSTEYTALISNNSCLTQRTQHDLFALIQGCMNIILYLRIMLCFGFLIKIIQTYCVLYVTKRLTNGNLCFLEQVKAPESEEECREPQPRNSDVFAAIDYCL